MKLKIIVPTLASLSLMIGLAGAAQATPGRTTNAPPRVSASIRNADLSALTSKLAKLHPKHGARLSARELKALGLKPVSNKPAATVPLPRLAAQRLRLQLRALRQRYGRLGVRLPNRSAHAADSYGSFTTHVTPENTFYLQLDVGGASTSPGAGVIDWWTNGGANQSWTFQRVLNNPHLFAIINQNSGQCLTTDGLAGDQVYQLPCGEGGNNQVWVTGMRPNTYPDGWTIESFYSGLYLDVYGDSAWPGAWIDTWYHNGGANQTFQAD